MTTNYKTNLKFVDCPFSDETNQKFITLLNSLLKDPKILEEEIIFEIVVKDGVVTVTNEGVDRLSPDYTRLFNDLEASATKAAGNNNGKAKVKGEIIINKGQ